MSQPRGHVVLLALLAIGGVLSAPATAQETHTWTVSILGGTGGAIDESGRFGGGFQLGLALLTDTRTDLWFRVGTFDFDVEEGNVPVRDGNVEYLTVGGEYQFFEGYYDSGVYLGLGAYQLDGLSPGGAPVDDTVLGVVLGVTGEFTITPTFAVRAEFAGHIVDGDSARVFATAHAGLAVRF